MRPLKEMNVFAYQTVVRDRIEWNRQNFSIFLFCFNFCFQVNHSYALPS